MYGFVFFIKHRYWQYFGIRLSMAVPNAKEYLWQYEILAHKEMVVATKLTWSFKVFILHAVAKNIYNFFIYNLQLFEAWPNIFCIEKTSINFFTFIWQSQCEASGQVDRKSALSIVDNVVIFYHMMKIDISVDIYHRIILMSTSKR